MKEFGIPSMTLIQLKTENIVCSSNCPPDMCTGHDCPDCATECGDAFGAACSIVTCNPVYHCNNYCVRY